MSLGQTVNLNLKQSLTLSPQLKQAIQLLSMNTGELQEHIKKEIENNPVLEEFQNSTYPINAPENYHGIEESPLDQIAEDANIFEQALTPHIDAYIFKQGTNYEIELNDAGLPKLRISAYYLKTQNDPKSKKYIREKIRQAKWLIKAIYERQKNFKKVLRAIIDTQIIWLDQHSGALKPLNLAEVASMAQVHESTVSRISNGKFVSTPKGIFEIKYFFSSIVGKHSSREVKNQIQKLITSENKLKPFSDKQLLERLKVLDIRIARRTITKYRQALGITSARKRWQ